jgi:hypothetical protein
MSREPDQWKKEAAMDGWTIVAIVLIVVLGSILLWRGGYLDIRCKTGRQEIELHYRDRSRHKK